MSCHETRERLSDFLDEALAAPEQALIRAHLDGCPDCRRELDRLRATVSLLSRVERPRAPVGFVDRVTAAARPLPWYRRLGRRLFLPLDVKLPAQAAAMLLIAVLGVYLLQRTPELRDAARPELETPAFRSEPSGAAPPAAAPLPAEKPAMEQKDLKGGEVDSGKLSGPPPRAEREAQNAARAERRLDAPQATAPSSQELKQDVKKEADADRLQKSGAPTSQTAPAPRVAESALPAPAAPPAAAQAESRAKSRDMAEGQSGTIAPPPAAAPPGMAAKRQAAAPSLLGRLNVKDRPAAERGLADLLGRVGGIETGRRQELGATVVEVLVPVARYPDFVSGLAALGAFTPEGQPIAQPTEPPQFRLSIRISE